MAGDGAPPADAEHHTAISDGGGIDALPGYQRMVLGSADRELLPLEAFLKHCMVSAAAASDAHAHATWPRRARLARRRRALTS